MNPVFVGLTALLGGGGVAGILSTLLRWNRDKTGDLVTQSSTVLTGMRGLQDELKETLTDAREQRDEARRERDEAKKREELLVTEVKACRVEIAELHGEVTGLKAIISSFTAARE